jgi:hypothetical protein
MGSLNIALLPLFGPATKEHDDLLSISAEINSIPRPKIDSVFENSCADALYVREISLPQPLQPDGHFGGSLRIKCVEPAGEYTGPSAIQIFDDLHGYIVPYMLPIKPVRAP